MPADIEVMVLDDEPTVGHRIKEFLQKEGMKVESSRRAARRWRAWRRSASTWW